MLFHHFSHLLSDKVKRVFLKNMLLVDSFGIYTTSLKIRGNVTFYAAAQDVQLDFGFVPQMF
jgi:hypothetical protein